MFLRLILKALTVRKSRVAIAFLSITIGAAIVSSLLCVYFDISIKMSRELRTYGANFFLGPNADSESRTIDLSVYQEALKAISQDVLIGASPYLYGIVKLNLGNAVLAGIDFAGIQKLSPYWQVEGRWIVADFDDRNCMIGKSLAQKMEVKVGDTIGLVSRDRNNPVKLKVKGIVETGQAEDQQVLVNLAAAQKILGQEGRINHGMVSILAQDFDIAALAAGIASRFPGIDAKPIRKVSHSEGKILDKITGLMAMVALVILSLTTLCMMTTLMAMVVERTPEIGLVKALGADNGTVVVQFLAEIGVIALSGVIAGIVLGYGLAQVLGHAVFASSISFRPIVIPLTLLILLAAALTAGAIPVRMTVKIIPAQVLKGQE
jgi:putative ABC transport system permease protein